MPEPLSRTERSTYCDLGHHQRSYECPACAEVATGERQPMEHWKWFRTRTSSKRIKVLIDARLEAMARG